MSFLKNWKLILASLSLALFTACAGSSGGSSDEGGYEEGGSGGSGKAAVQKEKIDENKLKNDAKNKLGIPVERPDAE